MTEFCLATSHLVSLKPTPFLQWTAILHWDIPSTPINNRYILNSFFAFHNLFSSDEHHNIEAKAFR